MYRLLCISFMGIGLFLFIVAPVNAASKENLNLRLQKLEQENKKIKEQHQAFKKEIMAVLEEKGLAEDIALDLESQMSSKMKISGYADVEYIKTSQEGNKPGFRMHHFSLFFTKKISDKWSLFSEIEYEDGPNFEGGNPDVPVVTPGGGDATATQLKSSSGKIFLEAMNVDYHMLPQMTFRIGRYFTPAGIWSIDHYPPFVPTQERPMHIRKIFPQVVDGLMTYGRVALGGTYFKYDLYFGNGELSTGSGDGDSHKSSGLRIALEIPVLTKFELGASGYEDTLTDNEEKISVGYDIRLQWSVVELQAEYATADYTPVSGTPFFKEGYYAQLLLRFGKFAFGGRNDFFNDYSRAKALQFEKTINSLFFNYRVTKDIVLKLEHHLIEPGPINNIKSDDYTKTLATIAVNLGN